MDEGVIIIIIGISTRTEAGILPSRFLFPNLYKSFASFLFCKVRKWKDGKLFSEADFLYEQKKTRIRTMTFSTTPENRVFHIIVLIERLLYFIINPGILC